MDPIDYTEPCAVCGELIVLAQSLAPRATRVIRRQAVTCQNCASMMVVSLAVVQGEAGAVESAVIPLAGGDSGGIGALLLD